MGGSSKHNGTKHSEKGPSVSSSNPGGQPASDSTMYFNEALARSWHGVGDFQPNGTMDESALAALRSHTTQIREEFDSRGIGVHVALQVSANQGEFHQVRNLPPGWVGCGRRTTHPEVSLRRSVPEEHAVG